MSASIAKEQLSARLYNLTYVNARSEKPDFRRATLPPELPKPTFSRWVAARIAVFQAWWEKQVALAELGMMSDRELMDIGLSRADLRRAFNSEYSPDLVASTED